MLVKLTQKQQKALRLVEYFIPSNVKDWSSPVTKMNAYPQVGLHEVTESPNGVSAEAAFFQKTERGNLPVLVNDIPRLCSLLWGQRWMATNIQMWKESAEQGLIFPDDFNDEPEEVRELFMRKVWNDR